MSTNPPPAAAPTETIAAVSDAHPGIKEDRKARRLRKLKADLIRVFLMSGGATVILMVSPILAEWVGHPEFAPLGMWTGLTLYGVAMSHLLRRALFPYLDMKGVAARACETPFGAGFVFVGVCMVLSSLLSLMNSITRG